MANLVDTSLWIAIYRDRTGQLASQVKAACGDKEPVFVRAIAMEILQGCSTDDEWAVTREYLARQSYLEMTSNTWIEAARMYFDLRRTGRTVRSSLDCCIAQLAIEHDCLLIHDDRDVETIATVRSLKHLRIKASP